MEREREIHIIICIYAHSSTGSVCEILLSFSPETNASTTRVADWAESSRLSTSSPRSCAEARMTGGAMVTKMAMAAPARIIVIRRRPDSQLSRYSRSSLSENNLFCGVSRMLRRIDTKKKNRKRTLRGEPTAGIIVIRSNPDSQLSRYSRSNLSENGVSGM